MTRWHDIGFSSATTLVLHAAAALLFGWVLVREQEHVATLREAPRPVRVDLLLTPPAPRPAPAGAGRATQSVAVPRADAHATEPEPNPRTDARPLTAVSPDAIAPALQPSEGAYTVRVDALAAVGSVASGGGRFPGPPGAIVPADVDTPPAPAGRLRPTYPLGARQRGEEGRVELEVAVDAAGIVTGVTITSSSGYADLDRTAEQALRRAAFRPARRGDQATAATVRLAVVFRLTD